MFKDINKDKLEKNTRRVFHKIHMAQGDDGKIFARLVSLLDEEYLKVEKGYFRNKICLDAGCGSNANAGYAMLAMGAQKVHCCDLDDTILKSVPTFLAPFEGKYHVDIDNILHMKYESNFFDFVHCGGVLHHTFDIFKGLSELARVTKRGGTLYIEVNGVGGLIKEITNLLRDKYISDRRFKRLIDGLTPSFFEKMFSFVMRSMSAEKDEIADKISKELIKQLVDKDLILTIKDRIQAPTYEEVAEKDIFAWMTNNGFTNIERLSRYPRYKNIRRFLSPFYHKYDNKYSRLLYGDGLIQIKATKLTD